MNVIIQGLKILLILPLLLGLIACSEDQEAPANDAAGAAKPAANVTEATTPEDPDALDPARDYHSFANADQVVIDHMVLDLDVDFERKVLSGEARYRLERLDEEVSELVLDTRALTIESVSAGGQALEYSMGEEDEALGTPLIVTLPEGVNELTVRYRTSPAASGVQWLDPVQTAGGEHPFLFTQSQAIHARSWIPLQDTPQVRFTYKATIRTPEALRAVMSAHNDPEAAEDGEFEFDMPQAIPSYLMALAVGDLDFKAMSERTGVYAEPQILDAAAEEFADTERMMVISEKLFGPYQWGRYDLLILPPSFPFGGMENPRLSFITPTVIAGDRSLVALIAHELAHSWSGNLVTNATWRDLWLNEGFTTYLTGRIMEAVYGADRKAMEAVLGYQDLLADLEAVDRPGDAHLAIDVRGRDPDDAFSNVPYEKGALMLSWLEHEFDRDTFDIFLRKYFDQYAFKSLTTEEFLDYLDANLLSKYPEKVTRKQVERWVYEPGIPDFAVLPESDAFASVDAARAAWLSGDRPLDDLDTEQWTVHEWLYFLNNMPDSLTVAQMAELDEAFALTDSKNNEIAHSWLRLAIEHHYEPAIPRLRDYLAGIGRRKLIVPLYADLMETDWGAPIAREVYAKARPGYHPLAQGTLDDIVKR